MVIYRQIQDTTDQKQKPSDRGRYTGRMATLTNEQFQQLLATIIPKTDQNAQDQATANQPKNDPSALGPIRMCDLGTNKMLKLTRFEDWLEEAENRMDYIGTQDDKSRIILLKSWGGKELMEFIKTHVKISYEVTPANTNATPPTPEIPVDSYADVIKKSRMSWGDLSTERWPCMTY